MIAPTRSDSFQDHSGWIALAGFLAGAGFAAWGARSQREYSFADRVVIITGGSRGLGIVLARELAKEGARLALFARDADRLFRAVDDVHARGGIVSGYVCDVRDRDQVKETVESVVSKFGQLDAVVNNAGIVQVGPLEAMSIEDFQDSIETHILGPLYTIWAALPHLLERGDGRIINISSFGGEVALPHMAPYCTGKFGLVGLSAALHGELAPHDICVTTVCPGPIRTGSPPNAAYKGDHEAEYAWFAIADSLPGLSVSAERAARQIIEASRHRKAHLTIGALSNLARMLHGASPSLMARMTGVANRILPADNRRFEPTEQRTGRESESRLAPSLLTALTDRAAVKNNEY